ncbi:MAG: archease [Phycisphaerales bacterium]|nr:MAG: archease [Phycisphaerales bacterium]
MPFEILDHTADIMLRVTADTREGLCDEARLALYAVVGELRPARPVPTVDAPVAIHVQGADFAEVIHDWLSEVLFWLESRGLLCLPAGPFTVNDHQLTILVTTAPLDQAASRIDREVKAVTYHQLSAGPTEDGWSATVILDI